MKRRAFLGGIMAAPVSVALAKALPIHAAHKNEPNEGKPFRLIIDRHSNFGAFTTIAVEVIGPDGQKYRNAAQFEKTFNHEEDAELERICVSQMTGWAKMKAAEVYG